MALVVWVFAGGGESEIRGLIPFLNKHFDNCRFERKTPVRQKPGPRPTVAKNPHALGKTGNSLAKQISYQLEIALRNEQSDAILILDDLDCCDAANREQLLMNAVDVVAGSTNIPRIIAFAAPELEAWLIADWENTVARDVDFRSNHRLMQYWLSQKSVPFSSPESFGVFDPTKNACGEKLSDLIIESSLQHSDGAIYSKKIHTPRLLQNLDPSIVSGKCPKFNSFFASVRRIVTP